MKKLLIIILSLCALWLNSCTKDDANPNSSSSGTTSNGKGGSTARFAVSGEYLYYVDNQNMQVYKLNNSGKNELVQNIALPNSTVETVYIYNTSLYIGSSIGIIIYDITTPAQPNYVTLSTHSTGCDPVVADSIYAYVTIRNSVTCNRFNSVNILEIYDVQNQRDPKKITTLPLSEPIGLAIDGDLLFVCVKNGIELIDVSDRRQPIRLKTISSKRPTDIIIDQHQAIVVGSDGVEIYEVDRANKNLIYKNKITTK
jgi:hypothetical protein